MTIRFYEHCCFLRIDRLHDMFWTFLLSSDDNDCLKKTVFKPLHNVVDESIFPQNFITMCVADRVHWVDCVVLCFFDCCSFYYVLILFTLVLFFTAIIMPPPP